MSESSKGEIKKEDHPELSQQNGDETEEQNSGDDKKHEMPGFVKRSFEQFGFQISHGRQNPLVEKMQPEHVTTVLENSDKSDAREHFSKRCYLGLGLFALFAICWLFLAYGATEHIDAIVSGVAGLIGGYGLGKASEKL